MTPKEKARQLFEDMVAFIEDFNNSTYENDNLAAKECALVAVNNILLTYSRKGRKNIKEYLYVNGIGWGWWNTFVWKLYRLRRTDIRYWQEVKDEIDIYYEELRARESAR